MKTYVLVAGSPNVADLVAAAQSLGQPVVAVVVGPKALADAASAPGVDQVVWLEQAGDKSLEAYAQDVAKIVAADPGVVVAGRRPAERVLLGVTAATVAAPVVSGVIKVETEAGQVVVTHGVYGGLAVAVEAFAGPVALLMDGGAPVKGGGTASVQAAAADPAGVKVVSLAPNAEAGADLGSAARVVGVGRGLKSADDLGMVQALAKAFKAEVGCSRPLAEGLEWLPRDRYVGISGAHITPAVYLMVGISGQIQHMGGCRDSQIIVSINTDKEAPVVAQSDYILTGDLYALVPALTAALG